MEERERILKLLEEGKITADQAAKLLEALGETYRWGRRGAAFGPDFGERIAKKIELQLKDLPEIIERNMWFTGSGEEKELKFDPRELFVIKAFSGDIELKGDEENSIRLKLEGWHKMEERPNELVLKVMSGDLDVQVPKSQRVELKNSSGDVEGSNLKNDLRIRSGSGDVDLDDISGTLVVTLGSGDVDVKNMSGEVQIALGSGDADIDLVETKGGRIEVGSGDLTVNLPEKANVELFVTKPKKGSIVSDFDFEGLQDEKGSDYYTEVETFKVTIGEPKAKLYLIIKYGDMTIRKRNSQ